MLDVMRCLRSVVPASCALVVSCNFLVGIHDLPFPSDDAGDEMTADDVGDEMTADATPPSFPPDASGSENVPGPRRDAGGDDAAPEIAESSDDGPENRDASDEEAAIDQRDANPPFDAGADDGKSPSLDAGEAGPRSDAGTNDGSLPVIDAGGPPDAAGDSNSVSEDAGQPDAPSDS